MLLRGGFSARPIRSAGASGCPPYGENSEVEIVGLVADSRYETLRGATPAQVFVPYPQFFAVTGMNGYLRSRLPAAQVFELVRLAVREVDPSLPVHALRTMSEQRVGSLGTERVIALLASAFGVLATLLAGVGLFGVLSYSVARRTREFGLRVALGAPGGHVARLVLKEVLVLCGLGLAVAIPLALVTAVSLPASFTASFPPIRGLRAPPCSRSRSSRSPPPPSPPAAPQRWIRWPRCGANEEGSQ